jgi:DNA-binding HxlR family transcriptional regulator
MNKVFSVYKIIDVISKKWILNILLDLNNTINYKKRYSEIKRSIPDISPKVLSSRLKELERYKLLIKEIDTSNYPIKCEYSLTESGKDLIAIIKNIEIWTRKRKFNGNNCD